MENGLKFLVSDSGPGINKEIRPFMFGPFATTKPPGRGIGMTLANAKTALHRNEGELFIDENRRVTTFVVRLPVAATV